LPDCVAQDDCGLAFGTDDPSIIASSRHERGDGFSETS
jgi:hypothetical protein